MGLKRFIKNKHNYRPLVDRIVIFVIGIPIGFFINVFSNEFIINCNNSDWKWYKSKYAIILVALCVAVTLYYIIFDSYPKSKRRTKAEEEKARIKKISARYERLLYKTLRSHLKDTRVSYPQRLNDYNMTVETLFISSEDRSL